MIETIKPIGKRCLIKPYEAAKQSTSGLILENSSNATAAPVRGTVISIGDKWSVKVGQDVSFRRYSADIIKIMTPDGEKEFYLIEYVDILGVFIKIKK